MFGVVEKEVGGLGGHPRRPDRDPRRTGPAGRTSRTCSKWAVNARHSSVWVMATTSLMSGSPSTFEALQARLCSGRGEHGTGGDRSARPGQATGPEHWHDGPMGDRTHRYRATCRWEGSTAVGYEAYDRAHVATSPPAAERLQLSSDPAFLGDPTRMNPESLLLVAAASCQMLSFLAVAARARIDVIDYEDDAEAVMPEAVRPVQITEIRLLTVDHGARPRRPSDGCVTWRSWLTASASSPTACEARSPSCLRSRFWWVPSRNSDLWVALGR